MKKSVRFITSPDLHAKSNLTLLKNALREVDIAPAADKKYRESIVAEALSLDPIHTVSDINIHIDCIIPAHLTSAATNVFIPNMQMYSTHWDESLKQIDFVLAKTREAEAFFNERGVRTLYIGWRGEDALRPSCLGAAAIDAGGWLYEIQPTPRAVAAAVAFVAMWKSDMPHLYLAGNKTTLDLIEYDATPTIHKIYVNLTRDLDQESQELASLRNTCKTHIHVADGTGCPAGVYLSLSTGARCVYLRGDFTLDEVLAGETHINLPSDVLENPGKGSVGQLRKLACSQEEFTAIVMAAATPAPARKQRTAYIEQVKQFRSDFAAAWRQIEVFNGKPQHVFDFATAAELPAVSIVTPTYNRRLMFRLAIWCFMQMNYARDKVQWIVVDDSEETEAVGRDLDPVRARFGSEAVTYLRLDKKTPLGEKRNLGVAAARHGIIIHMDDDDYYPADSIRIRVSHLLTSGLDAVVCTTIPMYDLRRYSSAINVPPLWMSLAERCSEATMAYKKSFWAERQFDRDMAEGETFLVGRLARVKEITCAGVIVSMLHSKNSSGRGAAVVIGEPNGCHYGFSDSLFKFLHSLEPEATVGGAVVDGTVRENPDALQGKFGAAAAPPRQ